MHLATLSHVSKWVACPDTTCSIRPAYCACVWHVAVRNCTTKARLLGSVSSAFVIFSLLCCDWVAIAFPLPRAGKEHREGNGKETAADGKDYGKEWAKTVRISARRSYEHGTGAPGGLRAVSARCVHQPTVAR